MTRLTDPKGMLITYTDRHNERIYVLEEVDEGSLTVVRCAVPAPSIQFDPFGAMEVIERPMDEYVDTESCRVYFKTYDRVLVRASLVETTIQMHEFLLGTEES